MDKYYEKLMQEWLAEERDKVASMTASRNKQIARYEEMLNEIATSKKIPETTNTIQKIAEAIGKKVIITPTSDLDIHLYGLKETTLEEFDGRVSNGDHSYPLIGGVGVGVRSIVDATTGEVIFENEYLDKPVSYQMAMLLGRKAGMEDVQMLIDDENERKEEDQKNLKETEEACDKVPDLIERGNKFIHSQLQEKWESYVVNSAFDGHHASHVENAIEILEALERGETFEDVKDVIENAHAAGSYGAMMNTILQYAKNGVEICRENHEGYKEALADNDERRIEEIETVFKTIEKRNKEFEEGAELSR